MSNLSKAQRDALPESDFAVPKTRDLPIHDAIHTKMAWKMLDRIKGPSADQRKEARRRILERAGTLGLDTKAWNTIDAMGFEAMSLNVPETTDHPNKLPFSGVLFKVNELSDAPPNGSGGKLVYISADVAKAAIPTILGMGVNASAKFNTHDKKNKIGVFTDADVVGDEFQVSGYLYASDFPDEVEYIQAHKDELGFSYEVKRAEIASLDDDYLTVKSLIFSGGAILNKTDAAYTSTSLSAEADVETDMTKEELTALLAPLTKQVTDLAASVDVLQKATEKKTTEIEAGSVGHLVKPHSDAIRGVAAGMSKAGMGLHEKQGHVAHLNAMADCMDAEAVMGKLPHSYSGGGSYYAAADLEAAAARDKDARAAEMKPISDGLVALQTALKDLEAKAFVEATPPARKTLTPAIQSLVDKGLLKLDAAGDAKLTVAEVDSAMTKAGITDTTSRIAFKADLHAAGRLA